MYGGWHRRIRGHIHDRSHTDHTEQLTGTRPAGTDTQGRETTTSQPPLTTEDQTQFALGETAVYSEGGDPKLQLTPSTARIHEAIVGARDGYLFSRVPDQSGHVYLVVEVEVENVSDESVYAPESPVFVTNGTQYDRTYVSYLPGASYDANNELLADTTQTGWIAYEIPDQGATGRLVVDFSLLGEDVFGEWTVDIGDLERIAHDYTGNQLGDTIGFGTPSTAYEFAVTDVSETTAYTYQSGEYQFEDEAADGMKYVRLSVRGENVGETSVRLPSRYGMTLIAASSQYDAGFYRGEDEFEGGEVSTGIARDGIVMFELPESTSTYEFRVELADEIDASWMIST